MFAVSVWFTFTENNYIQINIEKYILASPPSQEFEVLYLVS